MQIKWARLQHDTKDATSLISTISLEITTKTLQDISLFTAQRTNIHILLLYLPTPLIRELFYRIQNH